MKKYILIGAGGLLIIAITLLTKIVHVTDEERLLYLQEQHDKTQKRIEKIYENADKQAKPYVQERENIEQKAQELRNELFAKEVEYKQAEPIIEDMFTWVEGLYGVPYVLGGKSKEGIDCSGLFTLFGVEKGIVSEGYKIHVGNAYNLFNKKTAPVQHPERGNIVFMQPQGGGVNHIAMIHHVAYDFENEMGIVVIDASYGNGVQKRNLVVKKDYGLGSFYRYSIDGKDYTVHFATNPILSFEREEALSTPKEEITANDVIPGNEPSVKEGMTYLGNFKFTRYVPTRGGINCGGGGCGHFADGTPVNPKDSGKIVSCPYPDLQDYSCMIDPNKNCPKNPLIGKKLYIDGHGEVTCRDVGGLITMKGQKNSRGNISGWNRMDLFVNEEDYTSQKYPFVYKDVYIIDL